MPHQKPVSHLKPHRAKEKSQGAQKSSLRTPTDQIRVDTFSETDGSSFPDHRSIRRTRSFRPQTLSEKKKSGKWKSLLEPDEAPSVSSLDIPRSLREEKVTEYSPFKRLAASSFEKTPKRSPSKEVAEPLIVLPRTIQNPMVDLPTSLPSLKRTLSDEKPKK